MEECRFISCSREDGDGHSLPNLLDVHVCSRDSAIKVPADHGACLARLKEPPLIHFG